MSIFGWSYPPGCSGTPYDEPCYCEMCGRDADDCICPECLVCGEHGNPDCYPAHGLHLAPAQIASREEARVREENDRLADDAFAKEWHDENYRPGNDERSN